MTNHERIGKALDPLKAGLGPFVDPEMHGATKAQGADPAAAWRGVATSIANPGDASRFAMNPQAAAAVQGDRNARACVLTRRNS